MKIAIMQPTYLPWLGYFELMAQSDIFVYFDDVQFAKKSWQHRNKIKTTAGALLISIPIQTKGRQFQKIKDTLIANEENWRKKHLSTIEINYKKTPYFNVYIDELRSIYQREYTSLLDFNLIIIEYIKKSIGLKRPFVLSSTLATEETDNDRDMKIINICKKLNASILYDAAGAKEILNIQEYQKQGIELVFQNYKHPIYSQIHGPFVSHLSTIDLLFNEGERSLEIIKSGF